MKKALFFLFVLILFFSFNTREVSACDCIILTSDNLRKLVEIAYKGSEAVFLGEVVEINKSPGSNIVKVRFRIEKSWKNILQKEMLFTTGDDDGSCGYKFEVEKKYLVYVNGKMNDLEISICSRTSPSESNKDIIFLNEIKKPRTKFSLR